MGFKQNEWFSDHNKCCTHCKTNKTPLWRAGPCGPKSLCNACGIRYRKRMGLNNKGQDRKRDRSIQSWVDGVSNGAETQTETQKLGVSNLKMKLMAFGEEFLLQRSSSVVKKQRIRKLGEEEQAAFCLMALSSGSVFA